MSVLGTIREKTGLLLGVIILGLGLFLLQDLLSSTTEMFGGNERTVVEIYGENVDYTEYDMVQKRVNASFQINQKRSPNEQESRRLQNEAWNKVLFSKAYQKQFDELGIVLTRTDVESEEVDMVQGKTTHRFVLQQFSNPNTGEFDMNQMVNFLQSIAQPQNQQQQEAKIQWQLYKEDLITDRLKTKYTNLLAKSNFITTAEAEKEYEATNAKSEVEFVYVPYGAIPDSTVAISDEIISEYINEYGYKYEVKESRSVAYVAFNVAATENDKKALYDEMSGNKSAFESTPNDTLYVSAKSETPGIPTFVAAKDLPFNIKADSANLTVGSVYGPYLVGSKYYLYKVSNIVENDTVLSASASHILLSTRAAQSEEDKMVIKAKAEEVLSRAVSGEDFAVLAKEFSEDPGSKDKGGELGSFGKGQMVPPFENAIFGASTSGVVPELVETQFGFHIINVTSPAEIKDIRTKYLVSTIDKELVPSRRTRDSVYRVANIFLNKANDVASLKAEASDKGYGILLADNITKDSYGFGKYFNTGREMVRWVYEQPEVGVVADKIYDLDNTYIVLALESEVNENDRSLATLKEKVSTDVINNQKALEIGSYWKDASTDFEAAKGALGNKVMISAVVNEKTTVSLGDRSISQTGTGPEFIGASSGVNLNGVSKPVIGESGVLLVKGVQDYPAPPKDSYTDIAEKLLQIIQYRDAFLVDQAIQNDADIVDNRVRFY